MIQDPVALAAVIVGITGLGFFLERRFRWGAQVGASLMIIVSGALLVNAGLVAPASPVYEAVAGPVTSLAIVWLLLAVDLRSLRAAGPRMLAAFGLGVAATTVGAVTATLLFGAAFGEEGWKLGGVMTGTYSGGSLNFVAVGRALELPDELFAAATAADNVTTALWVGATLVLPLWLAPLYPRRQPAAGGGTGRGGTEGLLGPAPLRPADLARLGGLGLALLWAAEVIGAAIPAVPPVLWLTTLALAAAQLPGIRRPAGAMQLGTFALNLFFAVIGIGSRIAEILRVGLEIFYFTLTVVGIHGLLLYLAARAARLDVETTSVASQAAVGGPSTAMALAVARGWPELALPGLIAGLVGYAVGNYAGLAVAQLLR